MFESQIQRQIKRVKLGSFPIMESIIPVNLVNFGLSLTAVQNMMGFL